MALLSRRAWLAVAAATPLWPQQTGAVRPDLGPRLNALWDQALGKDAAKAVIVSSVAYAHLPPLRGWRDERFLRAYIAWSSRPETLLEEDNTIEADLGPYDWILLRGDSIVLTKVLTSPDPIGYTLLKPGLGRHRISIGHPITVTDTTAGLAVYGLSTKPLPTIDAAVAANGKVVTLYGTGFEGDHFEVASETGPGKILYTSPNQVNAELPSLDRVRLIIDNSPSLWVPVKR